MTHGSKNHRAPGAIGMGTTPGRVYLVKWQVS
jgi:large subunit ribosomal protein L3